MIRRCSIDRATPRSRWTCSTTTAPTCRSIRPCRPIFGTPAADADRLGEERQDFPGRWRVPIQARSPELEFHLLDTGHFALEDKADEMVPLIRDFLASSVAPG